MRDNTGRYGAMNESLWRQATPVFESNSISPGERTGVLVVGAGLTGLITACLLARAGEQVLVIDALYPGALASGASTGKLTLLQGARLSEIAAHHPDKVVNAYVEANRAGQQWLVNFLHSRAVRFAERPAYSLAHSPAAIDQLEREYVLGRAAGLPLQRVRETELTWERGLALRLDAQIHLNPMSLVNALVAECRALGVRVVSGCTATAVTPLPNGFGARTTLGEITAARVIAATGTPFLSRGGHFARADAQRSSLAAYSVPGVALHGMYLALDEPRRSLLTTDLADDQRLLLVGGAGRVVGREHSAAENVEAVDDWVSAHFPGAIRRGRWWAQDYTTLDAAPYVGPLHPGERGILVATGFAKWGIANAAAAAIALAALLHGDGLSWAHTLYRRRGWPPRNITQMARTNLAVAAETARGVARVLGALDEGAPGRHAALVELDGVRPVARCTVDGVDHRVSAVCPHLGGIVTWNEEERSWDCPLHGSRFAPDGTRIEGPARGDLAAAPPRR
ncbi:MAG: FAD-dependent oxidoreductase [Microterricola sp.]